MKDVENNRNWWNSLWLKASDSHINKIAAVFNFLGRYCDLLLHVARASGIFIIQTTYRERHIINLIKHIPGAHPLDINFIDMKHSVTFPRLFATHVFILNNSKAAYGSVDRCIGAFSVPMVNGLSPGRHDIIIVTSSWALWRVIPPAPRLFTQPFVQVQSNENIKAPRHWPWCGDFIGDRGIPPQFASNEEYVSIWWRHHDCAEWKRATHVSFAATKYHFHQIGD